MKHRTEMLAVLSLAAMFVSTPVLLQGQQASAGAQHEQHHPGGEASPRTDAQPPEMGKMMAAMRANDQKLEEFVKKMNAAQGAAKVDAIAEVLTTLVQGRRMMHESMMTMMMGRMNAMHGRGETTTPTTPK